MPVASRETERSGTPHEMHDQRTDQEDQEDDEEHLGDAGACASDAAEAQRSGHDRDEKKDQSPIQHDRALQDFQPIPAKERGIP